MNEEISFDEIYTADEVAEKLKISPQTIRKMLNTKEIKGFQTGKALWRIPKSAYEEYVKNKMIN